MIDLLITGINGKMGGNLVALSAEDKEIRIAGGVDADVSDKYGLPVWKNFRSVDAHADVIIDFSSPSALEGELEWATERKVPAVLAATGYDERHLELIADAAKKTAVFRTANFSLGINLLIKLVRQAAETLGEKFDVEIIEKHHNLKADAPSGTALMLAESVNGAFGDGKRIMNGRAGAVGKRGNEIGIHAVRGGTIVGEHEVMFAGEDEIITLAHSARSKKVFAAGALKAAKWLCGKPAGLYSMDDLL